MAQKRKSNGGDTETPKKSAPKRKQQPQRKNGKK